jgi:uncharacterized membrane protein
MPISDKILSAIGMADFLFILIFVAFTGFITRKEARATEKKKATVTGERAV